MIIIRTVFTGVLALTLLASPLAAEAEQTGKVYRVGFLSAGPPPREWSRPSNKV